MTRLVFHHDVSLLPAASPGVIPTLMYGKNPPGSGTASIGGPVLKDVRRLGVLPNAAAFDLLTVALAVTAADTFVDKAASADGWARDLRLTIPLADPAPWNKNRVLIEEALRFLSGDLWALVFVGGGPRPSTPMNRGVISLANHDCACLFSGGLDSTIGVLDLVAGGRKPVLISHAYRGDAERQKVVSQKFPTALSRFASVANPRRNLVGSNDVQMRTRSFNFLALGALVAATMAGPRKLGPIELVVPENGFIALNPPLTTRRIGALSTRTTHPHFLELVQKIFDAVGIPVRISTPYAYVTKGEMIVGCRNQPVLQAVAKETVSCGKWKRTGIQCGKCVPCLIRRASFHHANLADNTGYQAGNVNLVNVMTQTDARDDLMAMAQAASRLRKADVGRWVAKAGPLPHDGAARTKLLDVASRGTKEVRAYLKFSGVL